MYLTSPIAARACRLVMQADIDLYEKPTSHTELSKLANCEMSWWLRYVEGIKGPASQAMEKGSAIHAAAAAFWRGDDWRRTLSEYIIRSNQPDLDGAMVEDALQYSDLDYIEHDDSQRHFADAVWLMKRYAKHYGQVLESRDVVSVGEELDLYAQIPGVSQRHRAIIDQIVEHKGHLWMLERKTYGRGNRLDYVTVDPQLTLNMWVAKENGFDVVGIIFDGIYTHRWAPSKPTQADALAGAPDSVLALSKAEQRDWAREVVAAHPGTERGTSASFHWVYEYRLAHHIEQALEEVKAAVRRRTDLLYGERPIRNIGQGCTWCHQRDECYRRLAFPTDIMIDMGEEGE